MQSIAILMGNITAAVLIVLVIGLYILPTLVALFKKKRNRWNVALFNILLGWTGIIWAAMIVDAFKSDDAP